MDPIEITEEDLKKAIAEWAKKKGRQPNAIEVRQIYADMQKANSTLTEEERKRQEEKDKEPLTDSGIDMLTKQLIASTPDMGMFQPQEMAAIPRTVSGDSSNTIDPLTGKTYAGLKAEYLRGSLAKWTYYGMNLVDEQGKITNQDLTDNGQNAAANPLFQQLKMEGRLPQFLQALKSSQHYGSSSPSQMALLGQGMTNADYSAFDSFINSANLARLTPRAYMQMMDKLPKPGASGGAGVSYPSTEDTNRYLRQASFEAFGRPMTPDEAKVAFQAVRAMYARTSGKGGESAPSLDAAAQQAVAKVSGEEGSIYNLGLALDRMFKGGGSI